MFVLIICSLLFCFREKESLHQLHVLYRHTKSQLSNKLEIGTLISSLFQNFHPDFQC